MSVTRTGWAWPLSLAWLAACGPDVSTDTGGAGGATTSTNGGGGADPCETDEGYRICGGIHDCAKTGECETCLLVVSEQQGLDHQTAACSGSIPVSYLVGSAYSCVDGGLIQPEPGQCFPAELGPLFCEAGDAALLSFSDHQVYDCGPLPEPSSCPDTEVLELCGDACGPCSDPDDRCTGRSPRHPYSFCHGGTSGRCGTDKPCNKAGRGCLIYVHEDDPETQVLADAYGSCIDIATCLAAAAELPGGAECLE